MVNPGEVLKLCRLCLVKEKVNIPIFEGEDDYKQISVKIATCLPIKVSPEDNLPKNICDSCSFKLYTLYEFWNTSANAEKQLLEWLNPLNIPEMNTSDSLHSIDTDLILKEEAIDIDDTISDDNVTEEDLNVSTDLNNLIQESEQANSSNDPGPSTTIKNENVLENVVAPTRKRKAAAMKLLNSQMNSTEEDAVNVVKMKAAKVSNKIAPQMPVATDGIEFISQTVIGANDSLQFETVQKKPVQLHNSTTAEDSYVVLADKAAAVPSNKVTNDLISGKLNSILANQETIIESQNKVIKRLQNNEHLIIQQLAKFEAMMDAIGSNISHSSSLNPTKKTKQDIDVMKPIDTLDGLVELEQKMADKKMMEDFIQKLSCICGRKGSGNGINNCYLLVDRIFSRKFMTLCSWAGGARDKKEKIPFKLYKNVISLFFKVVHLSDEDFTLKDCEEFFKNVIRNSTRRNESGMVRSSTTKRRPKNILYKVQENFQVTVEQNETKEVKERNRDVNAIEKDNEGSKDGEKEKTDSEQEEEDDE